MSREPKRPQQVDAVLSDLVEYLIVMVPDRAALATLVPALAGLVEAATIRILDLVVVVRGDEGQVDILEVDEIERLAALGNVEGETGRLLSDNDIRLAARALPPGASGIVLVTEDRWAEPLSVAAQSVGGQIVAGDRIPPRLVEAALTDEDEL